MDEKQAETQADAPDDPAPRPDRRALAAAYLDLWERHVTHAAVHGTLLRPPRPSR